MPKAARLASLSGRTAFAVLAAVLLAAPVQAQSQSQASPQVAGPLRPAGAIPFQKAAVETTDGRTFIIGWAAPGAASVRVYAGPAPDRIDRTRVVGRGGVRGEVRVALPAATRWYFELVPDRGGALVVADRGLHLASAPNFRDLGGLRTREGRWVRMGLLYRSDQLDQLSDADLQTLHALNIRLVCDLRTQGERQAEPDRLPDGAAPLVADVLAGVNVPSGKAALSSEALRAWGAGGDPFPKLYRGMVSAPAAQAAYRSMVIRLTRPDGLPGVFHCTSGKDRTGWAAAVILSALGVPREAVIQDYLASNTYLEAKNRAALERLAGHADPASLAAIRRMMNVRRDYIEAAFDEVHRRYGSTDGYLRQGLGLDDATLAALRRELLS